MKLGFGSVECVATNSGRGNLETQRDAGLCALQEISTPSRCVLLASPAPAQVGMGRAGGSRELQL